jgi:hypothetical protein
LPLSLERSWNAVVRVEKLLEQMRQHPAGWRFEEVERVLTANGFELKTSEEAIACTSTMRAACGCSSRGMEADG